MRKVGAVDALVTGGEKQVQVRNNRAPTARVPLHANEKDDGVEGPIGSWCAREREWASRKFARVTLWPGGRPLPSRGPEPWREAPGRTSARWRRFPPRPPNGARRSTSKIPSLRVPSGGFSASAPSTGTRGGTFPMSCVAKLRISPTGMGSGRTSPPHSRVVSVLDPSGDRDESFRADEFPDALEAVSVSGGTRVEELIRQATPAGVLAQRLRLGGRRRREVSARSPAGDDLHRAEVGLDPTQGRKLNRSCNVQPRVAETPPLLDV